MTQLWDFIKTATNNPKKTENF